MTASHNLRAYLLLAFTTWCWGLNAIISRLAVGEISPMQLVTVRWLGVVLILAVIARDNIVRDWPILRRHLPFLCLMGSCGFTAFNALFYIAGHHTSAINIGILQGSIPIFVLLGSLLVLRQPISLIQGSGVAVTLLGVVIVASRGDPGRTAGHVGESWRFVHSNRLFFLCRLLHRVESSTQCQCTGFFRSRSRGSLDRLTTPGCH